jgi:excisionase family DNA binding protein
VSHTLLLTIKEVARELQVSEKTVSRLVQDGEIPSIRIRKTIRIPRQQLKDWIHQDCGYTPKGVGSVVQETSTCHINAKEVRTGGYRSPIQTVNELDALLERRKRRKQ